MSTILNEAFRKLESIDQDVFDVDEEGLKKLDAFLDNDEATNVSVVIDPDAEKEDDLEDSYVGKILCRCVVCHSDIMKDESDLHKDEKCSDVVNCGDECPMCQSVDGYKIIGRIAPYEEQATIVSESVASNVAKTKKFTRKSQKQINESVNPDLFNKLKELSKTNDDIVFDLAIDPYNLPVPFNDYGDDLLNAAYTEFQTDSGGELVSSVQQERGMSEYWGEGVYARWDFDDETEMIEKSFNNSETEEEFIAGVVRGLYFLVDFHEKPYKKPRRKRNKKDLDEARDVTKGENSIAAVLNKPENKAKMEAAGSDVESLKSVVLEILEADELKDNKAIEDAKRILANAKGFKFLTTLTTYMTGDKLISNKKYDRKGLKEALGTTYDAVLKILDDNGYDVTDSEVKEYADSAADYIEFSRSQGDMEDYTVEQWFKDTKSNYPEDLADLKRVDESFAASDLAKYQKWVDFDMKKYGKISGITQNKLDKAGLEVVKDDHGDYEVIAKEDNGNLINESVDSVEVKADGQKVEVKQEDDKTVVEVSKECKACKDAETIAPIDEVEEKEIEAQIDTNDDELDIDEFSEDEFDELGEAYLKRVYENVDAYKTTKGSIDGNKIMLEGVISFKSGKKAKTNFVFESAHKTKSGKLKLLGENKQLANNKAFVLTGHKEGKKLFIESFNYKYVIKDVDGKSKQLYGTVKK